MLVVSVTSTRETGEEHTTERDSKLKTYRMRYVSGVS